MLENVIPTKDMQAFSQEHMEFDHMTDKVMTAWGILAEREAEEAEAGSG